MPLKTVLCFYRIETTIAYPVPHIHPSGNDDALRLKIYPWKHLLCQVLSSLQEISFGSHAVHYSTPWPQQQVSPQGGNEWSKMEERVKVLREGVEEGASK